MSVKGEFIDTVREKSNSKVESSSATIYNEGKLSAVKSSEHMFVDSKSREFKSYNLSSFT